MQSPPPAQATPFSPCWSAQEAALVQPQRPDAQLKLAFRPA